MTPDEKAELLQRQYPYYCSDARYTQAALFSVQTYMQAQGNQENKTCLVVIQIRSVNFNTEVDMTAE